MKYTIREKLAALWGKLTANRLSVRVLALLLALALLQGDLMLPAYSAGEDSGEPSTETTVSDTTTAPSTQEQTEQAELPVDEETLVITLDGAETTAVELLSYEKVDLRAEGLETDAEYQWQIRHPETGAWINIYDATEQILSVSAALVNNMLTEDGTAALRCRAHTEDVDYVTPFVTVTMLDESAANAVQLLSLEDEAVPMAEGDTTTDDTTPEFVTITIEYIRYDYIKNADGNIVLDTNGTLAFSPYIATIQYNTSFEATVTLPTIVGYEAHHGDATEVITEIELNYTDPVTENQKITVKYRPANVNYSVRYYFQNIYDDNYVENATIGPMVTGQGPTGSTPDSALINKEFTGFTTMYYQPDTIAADGSTIFEVYYERNYYLMEFDCNEGYGTDTVYVRYGTYISIPSPVRTGWVFNGWDLVNTDQTPTPTLADDTSDTLPSTMPAYNSAYRALWKSVPTTYTVAYWLENGNQTNYLGGYLESAISGTQVSGGDTLGRTGIGAVCGLLGHPHTEDCFECGYVEHVHTTTCVPSIIQVKHEITSGNDFDDMEAATVAAGTDFDPDGVYLYLIQSSNDKYYNRHWPKLYVGGSYYEITINGSSSITGTGTETWNAIIDGTAIANVTSTNTATIYKANLNNGCNSVFHRHVDTCYSCNNTAADHVHSQECIKCGMHEHTLECRQDAHYLTFLRADTLKTVEGDGSTVVNVYYSYKSYTLRFYYARSQVVDGTTEYSVVGGSTYYFGALGDYSNKTVEELLENVPTSEWGKVKNLPELNDASKSDYVTGCIKATNDDGDEITYYYLEFTATFGSNLETIWPVDIFNPVEIADSEYHAQCPNLQYAYFSAWNGEHKVKYTQDHASANNSGLNETIKGLYMYLDEDIIFDPKFADVKHTDTNGTATSLVNFLGFWDNGANISWSVPKEYHYHILIQSNDAAGGGMYTYNGKNYALHNDFIVYDNSELTAINNQTAVALEGYTHVATQYDQDSIVNISNHTIDPPILESVDYYFYYDSNVHTITFWNHSEYLSDGTGSQVVYGTPLQKYGDYATALINGTIDPPANYPKSLEPGAYVFDAWYTTEACLEGTKMDWTQCMPDSDFVVYANWEPVVRNVYFYYDYADYAHAKTVNFTDSNDFWFHNGEPKNGYPIRVNHGSLVETTYSNIPDATPGYTFVGWFYMDENNKKRFAPDSMEVKRDLHLFAEWQSQIDTTYKVTYVLQAAVTDANGNILYPAGYEIATPVEGHSTAGKTKTFEAKGEGELYEAFRENYFPVTGSHSILMEEQDENNTKNRYPFEYVYDDKVYYEVRYVDYNTGLEIADRKKGEDYWTNHAVITERYLPITDYVPMPGYYYQRKSLSADGEATSAIEANVITFYYQKDAGHAAFSIEYYIENLDDDGFHQHTSIFNTADVTTGGTEINAGDEFSILSIDGYTYSHALVMNYDAQGKVTKTVQINNEDIKGTLDENGLTIQIYYTRNTYKYTVEYRIFGADKDTPPLETFVFDTDDAKKKLGTIVSHTADLTYTKDNIIYEYVDPENLEKELTIRVPTPDDATTTDKNEYYDPNVLVFYYKQKEYTVYYKHVCTNKSLSNYGAVSPSSQIVTTTGQLAASATPYIGYRFVGWYTDEDCTNQITDPLWVNGNELKPQQIDADATTYYALFEPVLGSMVINKIPKESAESETPLDTSDTFLFSIVGQDNNNSYIDLTVSISGSGSVTIAELPIGDYEVTELTGWSYQYSAKSSTIQTEVTTDGTEVTFTNTYVGSDWLGGESAVADNNFN